MSEANHKVMEVTSMDDIRAMDDAKAVGETLNEHYPNHLWAVSWQGGVLVVKDLSISSFYGMVLKPQDSYSSSSFKREVIRAGGELLERAKMLRGSWDGQMAQSLEGSDKKYFQPLGVK
jgi:hypothetical protein